MPTVSAGAIPGTASFSFRAHVQELKQIQWRSMNDGNFGLDSQVRVYICCGRSGAWRDRSVRAGGNLLRAEGP
eukprot:352731-Chlamydomonas_euryale.AAC.5